MKIIRKKENIKSFYGNYKGTSGKLIDLQDNIKLMREREIEAMVDIARNILFDRYEDVVSRESANKLY